MDDQIERSRGRTRMGIELAGGMDGGVAPRKRFFRQRAHINPLNQSMTYEYPVTPDRMNWERYFSSEALVVNAANDAAHDGREHASESASSASYPKAIEVADIGCGFGGLIMGLAPLPSLRHKLVLGMEIRPRVSEYVRLRILAARKAARDEGRGDEFGNASVIVTNAMKLLTFYFGHQQLTHMFFCFPDPHFKRQNHRRRIVTTALLAEYAYVLREGARLYTISDVLDLHNWMRAHGEVHPYFRRVTDDELALDPVVPIMRTYTEEGQKVERNRGSKYIAVFQRLSRDEARTRAALLSHAAPASTSATTPSQTAATVANDAAPGSSAATAPAEPVFDFWAEPHVAYEYIPAKKQQMHIDRNAAAVAAAASAAAASTTTSASAASSAASTNV